MAYWNRWHVIQVVLFSDVDSGLTVSLWGRPVHCSMNGHGMYFQGKEINKSRT